mmetsp:Transcript_394/g.738  ORF Transcript_394/g.738 Transcript_394/m.738 type:complete len:269 (-) Transcript_394:56-862(-)
MKRNEQLEADAPREQLHPVSGGGYVCGCPEQGARGKARSSWSQEHEDRPAGGGNTAIIGAPDLQGEHVELAAPLQDERSCILRVCALQKLAEFLFAVSVQWVFHLFLFVPVRRRSASSCWWLDRNRTQHRARGRLLSVGDVSVQPKSCRVKGHFWQHQVPLDLSIDSKFLSASELGVQVEVEPVHFVATHVREKLFHAEAFSEHEQISVGILQLTQGSPALHRALQMPSYRNEDLSPHEFLVRVVRLLRWGLLGLQSPGVVRFLWAGA